MDKYERRRQRLQALIKERCNGVSAEFARKIERDASYVARMLYPEGKAGKKRIADDMMEVIEKAYDLPRGYLDTGAQESLEPSPFLLRSAAAPYVIEDEEIIENRAKTLAQRATDVAKMWLNLPPEDRDRIEAELLHAHAESGSTLKTLKMKSKKPSPGSFGTS